MKARYDLLPDGSAEVRVTHGRHTILRSFAARVVQGASFPEVLVEEVMSAVRLLTRPVQQRLL